MAHPEQIELDFGSPSAALPQLWTPDDIFRGINQAIIEQFREDGRIERKNCKIEARALGDYLSMWSNTQPHGGLVLIGVEKDGRITGCGSLSTEQLNRLEQVRNYCSDARIVFKRVPVALGDGRSDFVLALRVLYREDKLVETTAGDAFIREGDEKRQLSEAQKNEVRINKGEIEFELEPSAAVFPGDFDLELVSHFRDAYVRHRSLSPNRRAEDVLQLAKLGKAGPHGFKPNLAGALLLAKMPTDFIPGARIRFIKYDGTEEGFGVNMNVVVDKFIDGPLPRQIAETERLLEAQLRTFTRLGHSGRFFTRPEYPKDALLEAIVNACVHRSYNYKNMNIFVKMFDDRVIVESPGGFFPPTTADTVYDAHNPRNPRLMEAMYYLDFVKCAYEGTRRMRASMQEAKLPAPEFSQKQVGMMSVHVVLRNNVQEIRSFTDGDLNLPEVVLASLSSEDRQILNQVARAGSINVTHAGLLLECDWRTARARLEGLVEQRVLQVSARSAKSRDASKKYVLRGHGKAAARRTKVQKE